MNHRLYSDDRSRSHSTPDAPQPRHRVYPHGRTWSRHRPDHDTDARHRQPTPPSNQTRSKSSHRVSSLRTRLQHSHASSAPSESHNRKPSTRHTPHHQNQPGSHSIASPGLIRSPRPAAHPRRSPTDPEDRDRPIYAPTRQRLCSDRSWASPPLRAHQKKSCEPQDPARQ